MSSGGLCEEDEPLGVCLFNLVPRSVTGFATSEAIVATWHHDTAGTVARKRDRRLLVKQSVLSMKRCTCTRTHVMGAVSSPLV